MARKTPQEPRPYRPRDTLAHRLLLVRHDLGAREGLGHDGNRPLSMREASERAGIAEPTWYQWEHGVTPRHAEIVLPEVARRLGIDPEWLVDGGPLEQAG